MKQKLKDGDEYDAISRYWRNRVFWQRGELKKIKRRVNKRFRQESKREIRNEEE